MSKDIECVAAQAILTKFNKPKSSSGRILISTFPLGFGIKFLIQMRERNGS